MTDKEPLWKRYHLLFGILTWIVRLVIGGLFVFSGMVKGIDVWGTLFKFHDYFAALGITVWEALNVVGVFLLCLLEFLVGIFLITGCFRRATPIIAALIMVFMLPLTLWLAIANPISDCGCFGDAIILTNWQTFWKNVIISAGVVWLLLYNRHFGWLITPYLQWIASVVAGFYFLIISFIGYFYQPLIDFRPYKVGTNLVSDYSNEIPNDEAESYIFIYEKNGKRYEFGINDELPDEEDGWEFIDRIEKEPEYTGTKSIIVPVNPDPDKTIRFFSEDGADDVTNSIVGTGRQLILMIPNLSEVPAAKTWKINSLYEWCQQHDIDMFAVVGGSAAEIEYWKDIALPQYPIYTSDDTSIKEVVRGNPAVVYVEDGIIQWKSSLRAIDVDDFQSPEISNDPKSFARDNMMIFSDITWIFGIALVLLILLSLTFTSLFHRLSSERKKKREQRKHEQKKSLKGAEKTEIDNNPTENENKK